MPCWSCRAGPAGQLWRWAVQQEARPACAARGGAAPPPHICTASCALQTSDFRLQTSDFRLQTSDFRLQTSDFRLQTSDFRLQTSDFRLQTSDFRLQTSDRTGSRVECVTCCDVHCRVTAPAAARRRPTLQRHAWPPLTAVGRRRRGCRGWEAESVRAEASGLSAVQVVICELGACI